MANMLQFRANWLVTLVVLQTNYNRLPMMRYYGMRAFMMAVSGSRREGLLEA